MYGRRFRRSAAPRGGFRRRRFGPRLRIPKEPARWEVCNVAFTTSTAVDDQDQTFTSVVALAQITDHFGDAQTEQGRAINAAARNLEIGGIVFTYAVNLSVAAQVIQERSGTWADNRFDHRILVCSDRIDAAGAPIAIPNWFTPGVPLVGVSGTAPVGDASDNEYPLRIHYQDRFQLSPNNAVVDGQNTIVAPTLQAVSNARGRANLRLRLRLGDDQGLFFHFATRVSDPSDVAVPWEWNCDVLGTMYYRFRF